MKQEGQRRTAEILGVNRKTVALALRRERLTGRMTHAVQTLLANLDDPVAQEVMPLDRIEAQVGGLVESVDEIYRLIDRLAAAGGGVGGGAATATDEGTEGRVRRRRCDRM